jgi:peptidoglycan/LPS O-acetylase OafA/YrhL
VRNRYLDLLRAAAIVRVIVYHLFGWPWLSILLPAMGIMFALAGSLTAASLDKRNAGQVITSRLRRLLPPLWLLAVIAVPAMLYFGWTQQDGGDQPLSWKLGLWVLPIGDPPGSEKGIDVWEPLWYIRAYLWFVVLSPLLYPAYRKLGWAAVAAPIVLLAVLDKTGFALPFGRADAAMWDFATYGACWIAGFAHHDGRLARIRPGLVVAASAVLGLASLYWLRGHAAESGWDLNDVSESQALWSLAFVLLALRWQPDMSWLARNPRLDGAVNLLNARAVTIYLWHNIAIAAIWPVLTVLTLDDLGDLDGPTDLAASLALTLVAVLAFGWVEDLAARRRPRLWPTGGPGSSSGGPGSSSGGPGASGSTGELRPAGTVDGPDLGGSPDDDFAAARPRSSYDSSPAVHRPARPDEPGLHQAPWAAGGAAPIVAGGPAFGPRRRDHVAPFPEAEVSFGFPDAGLPEVGPGYGAGRDEDDPVGRHGAATGFTGPASPPPQARRHEADERETASWFGGEHDGSR